MPATAEGGSPVLICPHFTPPSSLPALSRGVTCPRPVCDPGAALTQDPVLEAQPLGPVTQLSPPGCTHVPVRPWALGAAGARLLRHRQGGWLPMPKLPPGARLGVD